MTSEKETKLAHGLAVILLVIGILSYAIVGLSAKETEKDGPVRVMYKSVAGKVLFTHKAHSDEESGYGISCKDCHHHPQEEEDVDLRSCVACHDIPKDGKAPESCAECHEPDDYEVDSLTRRTDAYHNQCIGCHKENEAGPEECTDCHATIK